jgi:PAS domain S-box-containing protein
MLRIFPAPVFESEDLTRHAALVHRSAWTLFLLVAAFGLAAISILPANRLRWIGLMAGCLFWTLVVSGINRTGRPRHASIAHILFLWLVFSSLAWTGGGIRAPAASAFIVPVLIAGSLLEWRAAIYTGVLCTLTLLALVLAERSKMLPPSVVADSGMARWIACAFVIMIAGAVQYLSAESSKDALRISEQRFRGIFDSAYGLIGLLTPDGTLLEANRSALALVAVRREDVVGKLFWDTPWWKHSPTLQQELRRQIARAAGGETVRAEADLWAHDGRQVWVDFTLTPVFDERGRVALIIPEGRDVTARKRDEAVLRASEARFHTLFDLVPCSMAVHDEDGRILEGNAGLLGSVGIHKEEMAGHLMSDFSALSYAANPGEEVPDRRILQDALRQPIELLVTHRNTGQPRVVLISAATVPLGDRRDILTCAVDITDLRRAEEEQTNLQAQLYQAQKMEAIGRLAAGVAHDFNNLLTVIGGYTQLTLAKLSHEDKIYHSLLEVSKASRRAEDVTHQLIAFSRSQPFEPTVVNLNALIRETEKMLRTLIGEDTKLSVTLTEAATAVRADSTHLVQVLMNMAVNARDAMPEGGLLTIETEVLDVGEQLSAASKIRLGPHVRLRVSDTGTGMDRETLSHIFEPFFTTKAVGKGTGLGLSVVHGIVQQSGGSITVSSQPGAGTVFEILLPAIDPSELTQERPGAEAIQSGTETVLLADDDEAVRAFARQVLREAGYRVLDAADGVEALDIARSHAGPIGLLITDLRMPGIGGHEVARRLRLERSGMAVLYASGYASGEALAAARADESVGFLRKPFAPSALLKYVRRALDACQTA